MACVCLPQLILPSNPILLVPSCVLGLLIGLGILFRLHLTPNRTMLSSTSKYLAKGVGLMNYGPSSRIKTNIKRCTSTFLDRTGQRLSRNHPTRTLLRSEQALVSS